MSQQKLPGYVQSENVIWFVVASLLIGFVGGVAAALLAGLAVGLINGFFVTVVAIPSFLVTLGMMQLIRGIDMRITYTNPVPVRNETFDAVFDLNERTIVGDVRDLAEDARLRRIAASEILPRVITKLLHAQ